MPINVSGIGNNLPLASMANRVSANSTPIESFNKLLGDAVENVGKMQEEANSYAAKLAAGESVELHEVLLAAEEASLGLQVVVQVRNKIVEAYQEVMRMQV